MQISAVEFPSSDPGLFSEHNCLLFGTLPSSLCIFLLAHFGSVDLSVPIYICLLLFLWDILLCLWPFSKKHNYCVLLFAPIWTSSFNFSQIWPDSLSDSGEWEPRLCWIQSTGTPGVTRTERSPPAAIQSASVFGARTAPLTPSMPVLYVVRPKAQSRSL